MKIISSNNNVVTELRTLLATATDILAIQMTHDEFTELLYITSPDLTVQNISDPAGNIIESKYYFTGIEIIVV